MALAPRTRVGPYEILGSIGAGGMGEVYRARDTRLGRDIAVKVLPSSFAADPERLRRFEQEARTVAALNHPNILAIHDVGTHDGAPFLVTELLEGETLRERLEAGPLPVRKSVEIAVQAAHGVAAAHEKGVIHRDLKPANIFLTSDGRVKILDFGLAKLTAREKPAAGESQAATRTAAGATEPGMVLGTVGYMSPEQVRGLPADARSDIFALGAILYEMLSGWRAFQKDSSAETMTAILKEDPPELAGDGSKIPAAVDRIVRHCLEKNPSQRFQSARDLAFHLESLSSASTTGERAQAAPKISSRRRWLPFAAALLLAVLAGALGEWLFTRGAGTASHASHIPLTFSQGLIYAARFAPDGQSVYYAAAWNGGPIQLYATSQNSPESRPLGLVNSSLFAASASQLAISIGCKDVFMGDCEGTLATVPVTGGAPREIADHVVSADWIPGGSAMAAIREVQGKFQVEFPLGHVIYQSTEWMDFLRVSPGGNAVAFARFSAGSADVGRAVILDRNGRVLARSPHEYLSVEGVAWRPGGKHVWYSAAKSGWADTIYSLGISGKQREVRSFTGLIRLDDISASGQLLLSRDVWRTGMEFHGAGELQDRDLSWLDATIASDISPDGSNVAFSEYGEAAGTVPLVYTRKTDGSPAVKLGIGFMPVFSPDGKWVVALTNTETNQRLELLPTGVGETRDLKRYGIKQFLSVGWMPGGDAVYFAGNDGKGWRLYVQDSSGGASRAFTPPVLANSNYLESDLVSPDGKFAFSPDVQGKGWLFPVAGGKPQPVPGLTPEDIWVNWSSDGKSAYVYQNHQSTGQVFLLNLSTGKRKLVMTLAPGDPAGLITIGPVRITSDGKTCVYSYNRNLSSLFLIKGLQ